MSDIFDFHLGSTPILMSIPHLGIALPSDIRKSMNEDAKKVPDTDWDLDRLYDFTLDFGTHVISARYSRYVVDLNRPGDGTPLYTDQTTTGLVPLETFAGAPIYLSGQEPSAKEIERRKALYWRPYHQKIAETLAAIKAQHGFAILFDCHSIKSMVPRLFEGKLPDLNLGTADGASCAPSLRQFIQEAMNKQTDMTVAIDGRFKGGFITRNYGQPEENIHAYQMEHSTSIYMDEEPELIWNEEKASEARSILQSIFKSTMRWARSRNDL